MADHNPLGILEKVFSDMVGNFLNKIVGPPAEALGGLLGDQLKSWRASNLDRIARKWERVREERGISEAVSRVLPFGEAYRTIEAVSLEEDENVQEIWAKLIASSTDSTRSVSIKKAFIDLLKSLEGNDAIVLDILFESASTLPVMITSKEEAQREGFFKRTEEKLKNLSSEDVFMAIQNLVRLRIISKVIPYGQVFGRMDSNVTIQEHVRTMHPDKTADALISIYEQINILSGWNRDIDFEELSAVEVVSYAVDGYSFTHLGFELLFACTDQ